MAGFDAFGTLKGLRRKGRHGENDPRGQGVCLQGKS